MRKNSTLWIVALVVTLLSAAYQRITGPTYPVRGTVTFGGQSYSVRVERSHETTDDQRIELRIPDETVAGVLSFRKYPGSQPDVKVPMVRSGELLVGTLPRLPRAGKYEFQILLVRGVETQVFPPRPAITRFKDPVSTPVLLLHVVVMFLAMLLSTRAGLAALVNQPAAVHTALTLACLVAGGFVLGPLVQKQAFGDWWTGIPFGFDLTDNKTLIALVGWAVAAWMLARGRSARVGVVGAALLTLVVFMIPHSTWGSEIRWE